MGKKYLAGMVLLTLTFTACSREESPETNVLASAANICGIPTTLNMVARPGLARDVGADAQGNAWVIGTPANGAGYRIYQWTGTGWADKGGGATRIDVGGGVPWVVNSQGNVYYWNGSGWKHDVTAPYAQDIAIGPTTYVAAKSTSSLEQGGLVYRRDTESPWKQMGNLKAVAISADDQGPWAIGEDRTVYQWSNSYNRWESLPYQSAYDIAAIGNGMAVICSRESAGDGNFHVMIFMHGCWNYVKDPQGAKMRAVRVAGVSGGKVWLVKADNSIQYISY